MKTKTRENEIKQIFFNFFNFRSPQNHFAMDIRLFTPLFTPF